MKKILIPVMFISAAYAFYEQSQERPDRIATVVAFVIFMVCLMLFSSKLPSKNKPEDDETGR